MSVLGKFKEIVQGWEAYAFPGDATEKLAKARALHCADCEHAVPGVHEALLGDKIRTIKGLTCDLCKCPLSAKVRSRNSKCDAGKW